MDNTTTPYYAKSNPKILLTEHSTNVAKVGLCILNKTLSQSNKNLEEIVRLSCLLHDIAKIPHILQMKIQGYPLPENEKNKHRHNEIGWAFLYRYLNVSEEILNLVVDTVYWSHGISNYMHNDTIDSILDTITDTDIENMKIYVRTTLGDEYILDIPRDLYYDHSVLTPYYYLAEDKNNITEKSILARTCLISADRFVSKFEINHIIDDINISMELDKLICRDFKFAIDLCPKNYVKDRFTYQKNIASQCSKKTTILNAVAGFGKTNLGLLWWSTSNKKLIWICSTNVVAHSVYDILIKTFNEYGISVKIQKYLTNKISDTNYSIDENTEPFSSDIIVTNIDSYLSPTIQSRHADRLFLINNADVIFDEFHELNTSTPLMAAFINIMRIRHRMTDSRTLLLSATGINLNIWDSIESKTLYLPSKYKHFDAPHNSIINLRVIDGIPETKGTDELIIYNSKSNTQKQYYINHSKTIIHSDYIEEEKIKKITDLIKIHGKSDKFISGKGSVTGSPIIQNSLDISFPHLLDSVCSPEKSLQGGGRNNRWGNIETECSHTIFRPNDYNIRKSEDSAINLVYDVNLTTLWFNFIKQYDRKKITKNDFYILYNSFSLENERKIEKFIKENYTKSVKALSRVYPNHYNPSSNIVLPNANSNKLRSDGSEIYFIVKNRITNQYTDPFTTPIYRSFAEDFSDDGDIYKYIPIYKELANDTRFEFDKILKNKKYQTIDGIRSLSIRKRTPYILLDRVYDPEYGIIKKTNLKSVGL